MRRGKYTGPACPAHPELKGVQYTRGRCPGCHNHKQKEYMANIPQEQRDRMLKRMRAAAKKHHAKLKRLVIDHYGGKCKKCGIKDIDVLTIDHTANDGHSHRKEIGATREAGAGSIKVYRWLITHGFPKGFGVLCFNHNIKKHLVWMRRQSKN